MDSVLPSLQNLIIDLVEDCLVPPTPMSKIADFSIKRIMISPVNDYLVPWHR